MNKVLEGADQTRDFATQLAHSLPQKCILALYGDLGAGKTTFMQGLVRGLQGNEDDVHSPTFVYLHLYHTPTIPVFHFDLYRLREASDFLALGFNEYFEKEGITAIEWPERIQNLLPPETISLYFSHQNQKRIISYEPI